MTFCPTQDLPRWSKALGKEASKDVGSDYVLIRSIWPKDEGVTYLDAMVLMILGENGDTR